VIASDTSAIRSFRSSPRVCSCAKNILKMKFLVAVTLLAAVHASDAITADTMVVNTFKTLLGMWESAPYTVVQEHQGFEERQYPARQWAATSMSGPSRDTLMSPMFRRLYAYITGDNARNMSMAMTTPVSTLVRPLPSSDHAYTMAFFVPEEHQGEAPAGGAHVEVEERPALTVLTRRFGGYATDATVATEAQELADVIRAAGVSGVDFDSYYVAGYDPPFKFFYRRNEVWYIRNQ